MDIPLRPEVEAMIREDLARGPYKSAEELVELAVSQLHECEDWLAKHREELAQKIEEGWNSAKQGPLMDAQEVKAAMEAHKASWLSTNRKE